MFMRVMTRHDFLGKGLLGLCNGFRQGHIWAKKGFLVISMGFYDMRAHGF